jgi:cation diffusion facilitator family transporter
MSKSKISARRVVATSFLVDLSDLLLSLIAALASGSMVMVTQALQGGADLLTSGLLFVGEQRSRRRANREYNFGHGREIFFWILMSAIAMFTITAVLSFLSGLDRLLNPSPLHNLTSAFLVSGIGVVTNFYALRLSWKRLQHDRPTEGHAWHFLSRASMLETKATLVLDGMGVGASMLGIFALLLYMITGDSRYDGVGAMIIGATTGALAIALIAEVKDLLVGRSAGTELEVEIREAARGINEVDEIPDLRTMFIGSDKLLVNMEVHLIDDLDTDDIEAIMDRIKRRVKRQVPMVGYIQVEVESPSGE